MTHLLALLLLAVGIGLWYRFSLPVIRHDYVKFRAWRQRVGQWRTAGAVPPPEYQRDNTRWTLRVAALVVSFLAFGLMTLLLFAVDEPPVGIWALAVLALVFFVGAGVWGGMADSVR